MIEHVNDGRHYKIIAMPKNWEEYKISFVFNTTLLEFDDSKGKLDFDAVLQNFTPAMDMVASDFTEEQAKEIVEEEGFGYKEYRHSEDFFWRFAVESLYSLCRSHGIEPENCLILKMK